MDPTVWVGLATLIMLEIVLGIDNLVFISILSEKVRPELRDKARITGLALALLMRIVLLFSISWLLTLTNPFITLFDHTFSGKDIILLFGGLFLLFKATMELNERLEGGDHFDNQTKKAVGFWEVVAQIVVLDAVFSLDSVITAVHIADHLSMMIAAVCIAMMLMIVASKPLTKFVNSHPTILILCLSFLLMIGLSLVAEGFGFHIPKSYIYVAIIFSLTIESFNQFASFNQRRRINNGARTMRERTANAVLRLLGNDNVNGNSESSSNSESYEDQGFAFDPRERSMIERVLGLAQRSIGSIMTSRHDIENIDLGCSQEELNGLVCKNRHTHLVVTENNATDEPLGVVTTNDLLKQQLETGSYDLRQLVKQPLTFPENVSLLNALDQFRQAQTHFAFVVDEFGSLEGIVTLTDVMETIAGNLPLEGEETDVRHDIKDNGDNSWVVNGYIPLENLAFHLDIPVEDKREYHTLAGLLMEHTQRIPKVGDKIRIGDWSFIPLEMDKHRITKVLIKPIENA